MTRRSPSSAGISRRHRPAYSPHSPTPRSSGDALLIGTAFTLVQWAMVAPLTVLALTSREYGRRVSAAG